MFLRRNRARHSIIRAEQRSFRSSTLHMKQGRTFGLAVLQVMWTSWVALTAGMVVCVCVTPAASTEQRAPARLRPLNNLVTELLMLRSPALRSDASWIFTNPRAGWVFDRSTAKIKGRNRVEFAIERVS